ncbi:NeuD/PglB/VioB family sugar acetyltransferase [Pseudomonas sp. NPDC007930]|uniref:acetyltransferase n=1 Tax=Pseudomonas sp. NPDC007930 TaxID=3364417 RepID=UPI0036E17E89
MKNIIIVGAGGFGREVFGWLKDSIIDSADTQLSGFLDDNLNALDSYEGYPPILGAVGDYVPDKSDVFICAIANPKIRQAVVQTLEVRGAVFASLVHPTVLVGHSVTIGVGSIICPYSILACDLTLGRHVIVNSHCTIAHDTSIGNYSTLSGHCDVTGGVVLQERVFIGSHASVIPKVVVEKDAIIGAGSLVIRRVYAGTTVFGVPAKKILG